MTDTAAPVSTRSAAVVYNPIKVNVDDLRAAVEKHQVAAGWGETSWYETSKEDAGQGMTREAIAGGADMVIAVGGDGTVRAVAEAVHGSAASLALLPSGTGNLLARNLKLTLDDMDNALEVAFTGEDRKIDLGMIDIRREDGSKSTHGYVVMAGLGLDAKMLANTDDDLKKQVGWLAYVRALSTALRDDNQLRMQYRVDGGERKQIRAHTIIIGNCGALPANIVLLPDAAIDDGEFDILMLRPQGLLGWVQIFGKVLWENGVVRRTKLGRQLPKTPSSALRYFRGAKISVTLASAEEIELDGDSFGKAKGLRTWVEAGALTVRVPHVDADSAPPMIFTEPLAEVAKANKAPLLVAGAAIAAVATTLVALRVRRHRR
jgi:diacylglycerol kinase (ATP)